MSLINEADTWQYFVQGLKKSRAAAKQLAAVTKSNAWLAVVKGMDQLLYTATKLHASKPQTRIQTLKLAERISAENAPPPPEAGSIQ